MRGTRTQDRGLETVSGRGRQWGKGSRSHSVRGDGTQEGTGKDRERYRELDGRKGETGVSWRVVDYMVHGISKHHTRQNE